MTDYPSVVYLKAESFSEEVQNSEMEDNRCENRRNTKKKIKGHKSSIRSRKRMVSYKKLLEALNNVVLKKMDKIESKLDLLSQNCDILEGKVDNLSSLFDSSSNNINEIFERSTEGSYSLIKNNLVVPFSSKITQITLNTEGDHPGGSWLGYENNPEMRVRCKISPRDLHQINRKCITPEKMALALLDLLFDRETQACSNISGLGKHKKKQLDTLLIYGIRCHLIHRFDITEEDWMKVKIHMDSKCRTAFRRKLKGMSLPARKHVPSKLSSESDNLHSVSRDSKQSNSSNIYSEKEMSCDDISLQSEDGGNNGHALKTLMQIILSEQ